MKGDALNSDGRTTREKEQDLQRTQDALDDKFAKDEAEWDHHPSKTGECDDCGKDLRGQQGRVNDYCTGCMNQRVMAAGYDPYDVFSAPGEPHWEDINDPTREREIVDKNEITTIRWRYEDMDAWYVVNEWALEDGFDGEIAAVLD